MNDSEKLKKDALMWQGSECKDLGRISMRLASLNASYNRYRECSSLGCNGVLIFSQDDNFHEPGCIADVFDFMNKTSIREGSPYEIRIGEGGVRVVPGSAFEFVDLVMRTAEWKRSPGLYYCHQAEVFFSIALRFENLKSIHIVKNGDPCSSHVRLASIEVNKAYEELRTAASSVQYRRKVAEASRRCEEAFRSADRYVDALFEKHSRLLVGRVDLGFDKQLLKTLNVKRVDAFFKSFKNRLRSTSLGRKVIGYIWCLECTRNHGYHYHTLLFFDGSKHQKHQHLVQEVGNQWIRSVARDLDIAAEKPSSDVVGGKAIFYNCNLAHYQFPFLGQINHDDIELRGRMSVNIAYICKAEQLLGVKVSKGMRTMGRGELPPLKVIKLGRPRKDAPAPSTELHKP